jgi:hypothetical protein
MYCYRAYGLTVGFPIPVSGLVVAAEGHEPDITLSWIGWRKPDQMPSRNSGWNVVALASGQSGLQSTKLWQRSSANGFVHLFQFGGDHSAEFLVDSALRTVQVAWTNPEVDPASLIKLMLGPVLGLVLRLTGGLPMHAGAVATLNGTAIAFVGASGSGKSTMIASLLAQHCKLLSDDLVVVKQDHGVTVLHPGHAVVKLWPASLEGLNRGDANLPRAYPQTRKRAMEVEPAIQSGPVPLRAIFLLSANPRPGVIAPFCRVTPSAALPFLLEQVYPPLLPIAADERASVFARLSRLAAEIPIYRFERGEGFATLPIVARQIVEMAEAA